MKKSRLEGVFMYVYQYRNNQYLNKDYDQIATHIGNGCDQT